MKKLLALLLVFTMLFALVACGGSENKPVDNSENNGENNSENNGESSNADDDNNTGTDESNSDDDSADKEQDIYDDDYVSPAEDFEWKAVTGGIEITAYNGSDKRVVVPEVIENKKVVAISEIPAASPFDGNILIEELVLPKTINRIYINGCDNLRYLEMRTEELGTAYCTGWHIPETVEEWVLPNITVFSGDNARGPGDCFIPENSRLTKLVMPKVTGFALSNNAKNIKEIVCSEDISYIRYVLYSDGRAMFPFFCCDDNDTRGENKALEESGEMYIYDPWEDILIAPIFDVDSIVINGKTYNVQ